MGASKMTTVDVVAETIATRAMADADTPVLLMVSGGSDSTAMAYIAAELQERGCIGPLAIMHVNHGLRGAASDGDAEFVRRLADALHIPFFLCEIDVAGMVDRTGDNMEAVARRERYAAANDALESLCRHAQTPISAGRIFTAHTQDDRVENFYMRSIVGTGPGGFRSMRYENGQVMRPFLDVSRNDLRDYLNRRAMDVEAGKTFPWCATSRTTCGAKMRPTRIPTASGRTCATKSCRVRRNVTRNCSMCCAAR